MNESNENDIDENERIEYDQISYYNDDDKDKLYNFYDNEKDVIDDEEFDISNLINNNVFNNNEIDKDKYFHDNQIYNVEEEEEKNSKNKNQIKRDYENNPYSSNDLGQNNNQLSKNDDELPKDYQCPQDNNLSKKFKSQLEKNNEKNLILDKKKRSNLHKKNKKEKPIFIKRKRGRVSDIKTKSTSNYRKIHDKFSLDNKITKVKSFIFKVLISAFNILSEKLTKSTKNLLHQICGRQAYHATVYLDKILMKKQLKNILSDTKDDYNKNIINDLLEYEEINTFLELKLEYIFNYLRNRIEDGITEIIKKIETVGDQFNFLFLDELNLYNLYQSELNKRNNDDKEIIEDCIKKDFVKLINGRISKKVETKKEN
jgi:hypothetical protein